MKYEKLSVKKFILETKAGNIDLKDFYSRFFDKTRELDKNYFTTLLDKIPEATSGGALSGVPISVKDCICVKGMESTSGSRILSGYKPPFNATAVSKIRKCNGVVIGKTNQDEFGFGTFTTNSSYGIPENPIDPERTCGGSSGGAAGFCKAMDFPNIALAESTGGSISCPASFCGVVGLTPTYGLVSRYGLIDYANSLDKIGAIGKSVEDVALLLSVIGGHDTKDATSLKKKPENQFSGVKGLRIGVPKEYFGDDEVSESVWKGIKFLESEGAKYEEVSLKNSKYALAAYYIIATSEASTNLAKYCGMRYGASEKIRPNYFSSIRTKYFGQETKRRILLGTFSRLAGFRNKYYLKALKARGFIINEFKRSFKHFDILTAPTMPVIAPRVKDIEKMSPIETYKMDALTVAPNLAGIPMLSVPIGSSQGMPVGMHILGDHFSEQKILCVGRFLTSEKK